MKPADVGPFRMKSLGLLGAAPRSPKDVVRDLLAVQAQDLPAAWWAVGLRAQAGRAEVVRAIDAGEIVRSWPMRGTLHLTPAEDLGWMLALTTPRLMAGAASRRKALGIEDREIE